jgi:hypothetical protein
MTETEIKARLFDLRIHNCTGRLSIPRDSADHPCPACEEYARLSRELTEMRQAGLIGGDT